MLNPVKAAFVPARTRIGRIDYIFSWVASMLVLGIAAIVTMVVLAMAFAASSTTAQQAEGAMQGAMPLVTLALIMPASIYTGAILGAKRLHDMGRTGRWMIAYYACYVACLITSLLGLSRPLFEQLSVLLGGASAIALVVLAITPGSKADNRYGPVPPKF